MDSGLYCWIFILMAVDKTLIEGLSPKPSLVCYHMGSGLAVKANGTLPESRSSFCINFHNMDKIHLPKHSADIQCSYPDLLLLDLFFTMCAA